MRNYTSLKLFQRAGEGRNLNFRYAQIGEPSFGLVSDSKLTMFKKSSTRELFLDQERVRGVLRQRLRSTYLSTLTSFTKATLTSLLYTKAFPDPDLR